MPDIQLFKGGVPSFLKGAELDATTKALMGSSGGGKRISIKGNVFRMIANGEEVAVSEDRHMNIIVVAAAPHTSRTYYEGQFKEGENAAPVCWSADGVSPDSLAEAPQASKCSDCPQNIKGSGEGDTRACRYSRRLAVVLEGDVEGDVYQLQLPAQSLFGKGEGDKLPLEAYVRSLAAHNVPVTAVVTEMRFDLKSATPKLTFKPVRALTEAEWNTCQEHAKSQEVADAIRVSFQPSKGETKAIAAPKPAKAAVKAEAVEESDAEAEPVKVAGKKKDAPSDKPSLEETIGQWVDD